LIQKFAILLNLISTCVAMLAFRLLFFFHSPFQFTPRWNGLITDFKFTSIREQAGLLITMSCGMKTSLQLMSCRLWQTICATRNTSTAPSIHYFPCTLQLPVKHCFRFCRYARCTRSVSIGKPSLRTLLSLLSTLATHCGCYSILHKTNCWPLLDFLQCPRHTMLIWQPSELASTWSQIPLTVGQWPVVPVALHQVAHAVSEGRAALRSGPYPLSRKTWSVSCFTAEMLGCLHQDILEYSMYRHCFDDTVGHRIYAL